MFGVELLCLFPRLDQNMKTTCLCEMLDFVDRDDIVGEVFQWTKVSSQRIRDDELMSVRPREAVWKALSLLYHTRYLEFFMSV